MHVYPHKYNLIWWIVNGKPMLGTYAASLGVRGWTVYSRLMVECMAALTRWLKVREGERGGKGRREREKGIGNHTDREL